MPRESKAFASGLLARAGFGHASERRARRRRTEQGYGLFAEARCKIQSALPSRICSTIGKKDDMESLDNPVMVNCV
uniref:Predicted protein n=1 Tax=Hordeum vulgare subsp. vulgare TaxID=112509 RepID=F2DW67_HORVV|nr:predicted protein [Hordeum vulgare subsp. vulgare]